MGAATVTPEPTLVYLDPGGDSAQVQWTITNNRSFPLVDTQIIVWFDLGYDQYQFAVENSDTCGQLEPDGIGSRRRYRMPILTPIAPFAHVTCHLTVSRNEGATRDFSAYVGQRCQGFFDRCNGSTQWFGYLPDFSLHVTEERPAYYGDETALVRVSVDNPSSRHVNAYVGACHDFSFPPYFMEQPNHPEACDLDATGGVLVCFFGGFSFGVGEGAPGSRASCLVELRFFEPLSGPTGHYLQIIGASPEGEFMIDPSRSNDYATLGVVPSARPIPTLTKAATFVFLVCLCMCALLILRRRRS